MKYLKTILQVFLINASTVLGIQSDKITSPAHTNELLWAQLENNGYFVDAKPDDLFPPSLLLKQAEILNELNNTPEEAQEAKKSDDAHRHGQQIAWRFNVFKTETKFSTELISFTHLDFPHERALESILSIIEAFFKYVPFGSYFAEFTVSDDFCVWTK